MTYPLNGLNELQCLRIIAGNILANGGGGGGGGTPQLPVWTYVAGGSATPAAGTFTYDGVTSIYLNKTAKGGSSSWGDVFNLPAFASTEITYLFGAVSPVVLNGYGGVTGDIITITLEEFVIGTSFAAGDYSLIPYIFITPFSDILELGNNANNQNIAGLADPVNPQDAATMAWVQAQISAAIATNNAAFDTLATIIASAGITPTPDGTVTPVTSGTTAQGLLTDLS